MKRRGHEGVSIVPTPNQKNLQILLLQPTSPFQIETIFGLDLWANEMIFQSTLLSKYAHIRSSSFTKAQEEEHFG